MTSLIIIKIRFVCFQENQVGRSCDRSYAKSHPRSIARLHARSYARSHITSHARSHDYRSCEYGITNW